MWCRGVQDRMVSSPRDDRIEDPSQNEDRRGKGDRGTAEGNDAGGEDGGGGIGIR